ncbi:unnamed protein product [Somion occarium]|uniref:Uncharacterized protein n=1 Tax=Somion occarium TaxID=3059160 RepID=A0ABP1E7L9_9APHY
MACVWERAWQSQRGKLNFEAFYSKGVAFYGWCGISRLNVLLQLLLLLFFRSALTFLPRSSQILWIPKALSALAFGKGKPRLQTWIMKTSILR